MKFKTEEDVITSLEEAASMVVRGNLTKDQSESIVHLADIALLAIRQQNPAKYGYFIWNQNPLYGPYGSTLKLWGQP